MDIALIVAKLLGTYLVVSGLFLIMRGKTVPHLLKDFFGHPAIVYLTGLVLVTLSTLLIIENNVWNGSWYSVISVFAWLVLLKGLGYIFFPEVLQRMARRRLAGSLSLFGLVAVIIGVYIFFLG